MQWTVLKCLNEFAISPLWVNTKCNNTHIISWTYLYLQVLENTLAETERNVDQFHRPTTNQQPTTNNQQQTNQPNESFTRVATWKQGKNEWMNERMNETTWHNMAQHGTTKHDIMSNTQTTINPRLNLSMQFTNTWIVSWRRTVRDSFLNHCHNQFQDCRTCQIVRSNQERIRTIANEHREITRVGRKRANNYQHKNEKWLNLCCLIFFF